MEKTFTVSKKDVYMIVEGLSANIGRKNPDIDFETIWASEGDEKNLDLYYKEAIGDLEEYLKKWVAETTEAQDIDSGSVIDDEYTLSLNVNDAWPDRLENLLTSKIQDYLAHATLAGWLSGYKDLAVGSYSEIAVADLEGIVAIVTRVDTKNDGKSRHGNAAVMSENVADEVARTTDSATNINGSNAADEVARTTDSATNINGSNAADETTRITDDATNINGSNAADETARKTDGVSFGIPHEYLNLSGVINNFNNFQK